MRQRMITPENNYAQLDDYLEQNHSKNIFVVCGNSIRYFEGIQNKFAKLAGRGIEIHYFRDFTPNPQYESVVKGVKAFRQDGCDTIFAVGGGSAMDVAKCVKLFCNMESDESYLIQQIVPNRIPFLAMPTTAGSGSEATRFAVIYKDNVKQSIQHDSCIPDGVVMDADVLDMLPLYQRKSTMCDALCHALESFWSVNSTDESRRYSAKALQQVIENMDGYIAGDRQASAGMLLAANIAGRAINIAQTTAGHAMCYQITHLYRCAHGHAAMLCNRRLFSWMLKNMEKCIDIRGTKYIQDIFDQIARIVKCANAQRAAEWMEKEFQKLQLEVPAVRDEEYKILKASVNPVRLRNFPFLLDSEAIDMLYHEIMSRETLSPAFP